MHAAPIYNLKLGTRPKGGSPKDKPGTHPKGGSPQDKSQIILLHKGDKRLRPKTKITDDK